MRAIVIGLLGVVLCAASCGSGDKRKQCGPSEADSGGEECALDTDCSCTNQICMQGLCYVLCNSNAECTAAAAGNSKYCNTLKNGRKACYTVPN